MAVVLAERLHDEAEMARGFDQYEEVVIALHEVVDFDALEQWHSEAVLEVPTSTDVAAMIKLPGFYGDQAVQVTPLDEAYTVWDHVQIFDKRETEQLAGAFKVRGAHAYGRKLMEEFPQTKHLVAYSAGNHGLGVAMFVRWWNEGLIRDGVVRVDELGTVLSEDADKLLQAHIFVKNDASPDKVAALQAFIPYGTKLHIGGDSLEGAGKLAQQFIGSHTAPDGSSLAQMLPPYQEATVMAGQGTVMLETFMQLRAQGVDLQERPLVVDVAGGGFGLAIGSAVFMSELIRRGMVHPGSYVRASQMEGCDNMVRAQRHVDQHGTLDWPDLFENGNGAIPFDPSADGTAVYTPDVGNVERVHYLHQLGVLRLETISKRAVAARMRQRQRHGFVVEPAGAIAGAQRDEWVHQRERYWVSDLDGSLRAADAAILVAVESGGNVSEDTVREFEAVLGAGSAARLLGGWATSYVAPNVPQDRLLDFQDDNERPERPLGRTGLFVF